MLILLSLASLCLFLWISYLRFVYFSRVPEIPETFVPGLVRSPAEGTIVYHQVGVLPNLPVIKENRNLSVEFSSEGYWHQVGIFMSQYDVHYVVNQIDSEIVSTYKVSRDEESEMLTYLDMFLSLFGVKFFQWSKRCLSFLSYNSQWFIRYKNGIVMIITMDKYVNIFDLYPTVTHEPSFLGFIRRGSQTDIFIPSELRPSLLAPVHSRVSFFTPLFSYDPS
jgi:hypothetical protein